jgi:hypothetical protein
MSKPTLRERGLLPRNWSDLRDDAERRAWLEERYTPEPNTGCWLWLMRCDKKGYGVAFFGENRGGQLAHRVIYREFVGPIPDGMFLCHKCDTPCCVNPAHMFIGDNTDNVQDMARKGRKAQPDFEIKVTPDIVRELRAEADGGTNLHELSRRFSIPRTTVRQIVRRRSWKHVA